MNPNVERARKEWPNLVKAIDPAGGLEFMSRWIDNKPPTLQMLEELRKALNNYILSQLADVPRREMEEVLADYFSSEIMNLLVESVKKKMEGGFFAA